MTKIIAISLCMFMMVGCNNTTKTYVTEEVNLTEEVMPVDGTILVEGATDVSIQDGDIIISCGDNSCQEINIGSEVSHDDSDNSNTDANNSEDSHDSNVSG